jgi:hypothetical protein
VKKNQNGMFIEIIIGKETHLIAVLAEIMVEIIEKVEKVVLPIMKVVLPAANAPATRITGMMTMIGSKIILAFGF